MDEIKPKGENKMPEVKTQTTKNVTEEPAAFNWNDVVKRSKEMPTIHPKLKVDEKVGSHAIVTFLEKQPRVIPWINPKTKESDPFPVITVQTDDGMKHTLGCSAVSLQNDLGKIYAEHGTLEGIKARIERYEYKHKEWGMTSALRVTELATVKGQD